MDGVDAAGAVVEAGALSFSDDPDSDRSDFFGGKTASFVDTIDLTPQN